MGNSSTRQRCETNGHNVFFTKGSAYDTDGSTRCAIIDFNYDQSKNGAWTFLNLPCIVEGQELCSDSAYMSSAADEKTEYVDTIDNETLGEVTDEYCISKADLGTDDKSGSNIETSHCESVGRFNETVHVIKSHNDDACKTSTSQPTHNFSVNGLESFDKKDSFLDKTHFQRSCCDEVSKEQLKIDEEIYSCRTEHSRDTATIAGQFEERDDSADAGLTEKTEIKITENNDITINALSLDSVNTADIDYSGDDILESDRGSDYDFSCNELCTEKTRASDSHFSSPRVQIPNLIRESWKIEDVQGNDFLQAQMAVTEELDCSTPARMAQTKTEELEEGPATILATTKGAKETEGTSVQFFSYPGHNPDILSSDNQTEESIQWEHNLQAQMAVTLGIIRHEQENFQIKGLEVKVKETEEELLPGSCYDGTQREEKIIRISSYKLTDGIKSWGDVLDRYPKEEVAMIRGMRMTDRSSFDEVVSEGVNNSFDSEPEVQFQVDGNKIEDAKNIQFAVQCLTQTADDRGLKAEVKKTNPFLKYRMKSVFQCERGKVPSFTSSELPRRCVSMGLKSKKVLIKEMVEYFFSPLQALKGDEEKCQFLGNFSKGLGSPDRFQEFTIRQLFNNSGFDYIPLPRTNTYDVHAVFASDVFAPRVNMRTELRWISNCPLIQLYCHVDHFYFLANNARHDDNSDDENFIPVTPESWLHQARYDDPDRQFLRPFTEDHLTVQLLRILPEVRNAETWTLYHDKSEGAIFAGRDDVRENRDFRIVSLLGNFDNVAISKCISLGGGIENTRARLCTMLCFPASQAKVSDIIMQTFLKHKNILRMDTAIVEGRILKIFMESTQALLQNAGVQWSDTDILKIMYGLVGAVHTLHQNEAVHLDIHDGNILLRNIEDPSSVAIYNFRMAQFFSNIIIPLDLDDITPQYIPPEWWHITMALRKYDASMKRVDAWQLGCVLVKLLFCQNLSEITPREYQNLMTQSRRTIHVAINRKIGKRVVDCRIRNLLIGLLEPCPLRRMTVGEAMGILRQTT